jgi:hypothetical protein
LQQHEADSKRLGVDLFLCLARPRDEAGGHPRRQDRYQMRNSLHLVLRKRIEEAAMLILDDRTTRPTLLN